MSMDFLTGVVFNAFTDAIIKLISNPIFIVLVIIALGYLIGRINIKGISFGSSGVFIVALIVGIVLSLVGDKMIFTRYAVDELGNVVYEYNTKGELIKKVAERIGFTWVAGGGGATVSTIKNIGLALFVTGVGFVAGPTFIRNFKKKALSFITIGISVVALGTLMCILFIAIDKNLSPQTAAGLLMGALTSTPGLSSAIEVFGDSNTISAASGLAYPFGVLGVVLFVQLMPKILKKDIDAEVAKLKASADKSVKVVDEAIVVENEVLKPKAQKKLIELDSLGICAFAMAAALGTILGALTIPMGSLGKFALGTTGGALIMGLLFGHFGHVGPLSLNVPKQTVNSLKELGLIFFLAGSGIEGGIAFLENFRAMQLLYGALMTLIPMIGVFCIGRFVFKLDLLNNLGSITGGMTSTPALGALIHTAKTDDVAQSYAATYPVALFLLVLAPQVINLIF